MANETDTGLMGQTTTAEALVALATEPFDPATLLTSRPDALPNAVGPTDERSPVFDPATLLGAAARRGPAMIGDGRPLMARIGGVEVVTIPLEHYAGLLGPAAPLYETAAQMRRGQGADAVSMLRFLLSLHARKLVSDDDLVETTGLDLVDLVDRVAAYKAAQPKPWPAEMGEDGSITGLTDTGRGFHLYPEGHPLYSRPAPEGTLGGVAPTPEPAPLSVALSPEEATIDPGRPAGMPEETSIAIPPGPLNTRTTPPEPEKSTTYSARRREKHEKRGGPMDAKGQPDDRETDVHDTMPRGRRDGFDRA